MAWRRQDAAAWTASIGTVAKANVAPVAVAVLAFGWAWILSGDALAMRLNWDTASYVAKYASGHAGWADAPWNSHFALGPAYWVGYALAWPFGGSFIDGVRLLNALCFAVGTGFVAAICGRLAFTRGAALLAGVFYLTSWGMGQLVLSLEDNVVYLPFVGATLWLCVRHFESWDGRVSLVAGLCVAGGVLISWQCGLYLFPALYTAVFFGQKERPGWRRVAHGALVFVGFALGLCVWVVFYGLTAPGLSFSALFCTLLSKPEPSFFPDDWREVSLLLRGPRRIFRHLGNGLGQEIGPIVTEWHAFRARMPEIGQAFFMSVLALVGGATWWGWARRQWRFHWAALLLLVLTAATSIYVDLPSDKYKRYEYLVLALALVVAAAWGALGRSRGVWVSRAVGGTIAALCVLQAGMTVRWALDHRAQLPRREPALYFGIGHQPWFVHLRRLRADTPDRCRYVFDLTELSHGRFQLEIPAALWAEMPAHVALGAPQDIAKWRHPIRVESPVDFGVPRACDWLSAAAKARLLEARVRPL